MDNHGEEAGGRKLNSLWLPNITKNAAVMVQRAQPNNNKNWDDSRNEESE